MAKTRIKLPWLVRINYRMRVASFAMAFVAVALHIYQKNYSLGIWVMLGLVFFVYPHLQYWRVSRAAKPLPSEMRNLLVDSVLLGGVVSAIGFPLWIAFSAAIAALTNNAINKGWRGVVENALALAAGALAWSALMGLNFSPPD